MKPPRIHYWLGLFVGICCYGFAGANTAAAVAAALKVMTFNIKGAAVEIGFDQEQSWDYIWNNNNDRRGRVVSVINDSAADIVGVQELRLGQLEYLDGRLSDYAYYGVGRNSGTASDSAERAGIFYRRSRFSRLDQGEFWLSDSPTTPGTTFVGNGGDTNNPRMATWVKLRDHQVDQDYFVINAHWALDSEARRLSGLLMRDKIMELGDGLPIIVTGDFNETASSGAGCAALVRRRTANEFRLTNAYAQAGAPSGRTFHGYNGGVEGAPIDLVLHTTEDFVPIAGRIVRTTFSGHYPSDHYPLEVTLDVLPRLLGDYTLDRTVDAADYNVWKANFALSSSPADGNRNGVVDAADYTVWRDALGNGLAEVAAIGQLVVPEPDASRLALFAFCCFAVGAVRMKTSGHRTHPSA